MEPKFKVGDKVHCFRMDSDSMWGFNFYGEVLSVSDTGDGYEYNVSNAPFLIFGFPILIWEHEMENTK